MWTLLTIQAIIVLLLSSQTILEVARAPGSIPNEQYVTIEADIKLNLRVQCMGPNFDNKSQPLTPNIILLEVGGGSSGADLIGLQLKFKETYSVCTYDRAGYGKSQQGSQGAPSEIYNNTMRQMVEAMKAVGVPIDGTDRRIVCVGHSIGGQLCRHYGKYLPSIKTIV